MNRFNLSARIAVALAALAGSSSMSALAAAADGAIDTTFGTNGRTVVDFDTLPANPIDIVLDTSSTASTASIWSVWSIPPTASASVSRA